MTMSITKIGGSTKARKWKGHDEISKTVNLEAAVA